MKYEIYIRFMKRTKEGRRASDVLLVRFHGQVRVQDET